MIQHIKIDGKEYPFLFSFRAVFSFMNSSNIQSLEEADQATSLDFDALLKLYEQASKKGAKKAGDKELELTAEQIEDAIDEEPSLFVALQEAFEQSKVMRELNSPDKDTSKK